MSPHLTAPGSSAVVDPATWQRLSPLLDAALDLPEPARATWLAALPAEHADLRPRLAELLAVDPRALCAGAGAAFLGDATRHPGERVGPYRLIERLGAGGMGEVWRAARADGLMEREVALKLPFAWAGGLAARLGRERNILAALEHPNIARLYDAGIAEGGQPWLALEVVHGQRIDHWADAHALDVPARLRLALQAVRAVAHAHAQLVVHRDLKPSNLLVDDAGQVKLLDFGIAKLLDAEDGVGPGRNDLTEQGVRLMTPGYASPEQVAGGPVGTRSDVYALGVLLHELLAGVSPYGPVPMARAELEAAVLHTEPRRPSDVATDPRRRKALRGDLDTLLLRALAKPPGARYATADALADDIERHLSHRPLQARPETRWRLAAKWVRRHAVAFGTGLAMALALVAGSGVALWQGLQARAERERAEQVKAFVVGILKDASPYLGRDVAHLTASDLVLQAEQRLRHTPIASAQVRTELGVLLGEALLTSSNLEAGEARLGRTRDEARRELGDADPYTVRARVAAAQTLRLRGRVAEQQQVLAEVLPQARRLADADPGLLVETLAHAALNAIDRSAFAEAEARAVEGDDLARRRLPEDHPDAASMVVLRALTHLSTRRYDEARAAGEEGLRRARALHPDGIPHPRLFEALVVSGRALAESGELDRGVARIAEAVRMGRAMYGDDDMPLALSYQNLALYQLESGDAPAAETAARRAVAALAQAMPPDALPLATTRATWGAALLAAGRTADALAELDTARQALERGAPAASDAAVMAAVNAALALARLGRGDEAGARLVALATRLDGPAVQRATRERARLARAAAERARGLPREALATLQPLLDGAGGPPRVQRERMRAWLEAGQVRLALGQRDAAASAFETALSESRRLEGAVSATRVQAQSGWQVARGAP